MLGFHPESCLAHVGGSSVVELSLLSRHAFQRGTARLGLERQFQDGELGRKETKPEQYGAARKAVLGAYARVGRVEANEVIVGLGVEHVARPHWVRVGQLQEHLLGRRGLNESRSH